MHSIPYTRRGHICGGCSHEIEYCRNPVRKHKDKEPSAHAVAIENPDVDAACLSGALESVAVAAVSMSTDRIVSIAL